MTHTMMKRAWAGAFVCALALGALTGCGMLPNIPGIPNITADEKGGSITIRGDDGDSLTFDTDTSGEIPGWFAEQLPLPSDYTVEAATEMSMKDGTIKSLSLATTVDYDTLVKTIDDGLSAASLTPDMRNVADVAGMRTAMYAVEIGDEVWMINILDYGEGEDEDLYVTYNTGTDN